MVKGRVLGEADHTETNAVEGSAGLTEVAAGRAAVPGVEDPGACAQQPRLTSFIIIIILIQPGAAIEGGTFIISVPVIQAPFLHIAVHIVQAPGIGGKHSHRRALLPVLTLGAIRVDF